MTITAVYIKSNTPLEGLQALPKDPRTRIFDHIIYCLGGTTPADFLKAAGIELEGRCGYATVMR
jgi:hypothetical protein